MEILPIFVPEDGDCSRCSLWTVKFPEETTDEFDQLFQDWNNVAALFEFFKANEEIIDSPFWRKKYGSISEFVFGVIHEAEGFERDLLSLEVRILEGEEQRIVN